MTKNDGNRYFYLDDGNYKSVSSRYVGERTSITVNGIVTGQNAGGEVSYFTTDLLGSVRSTTDSTGFGTNSYTYDVFGSLVEGELSGASDYGYLGKQFDPQTGLYNYGYRDYAPGVARFTTVDPIRDGENWFAYVNNDPVNFVDLWGLSASDADMAGVPPQYRAILQQQKGKNTGKWVKNGEFQETYENTPISKNAYKHNGEDYKFIKDGADNTKGADVNSNTEGIVVGSGYDPKNPKGADPNNKGNWVRIQQNDGNTYDDYYHLDTVDVKNGDKVKIGTKLGTAGNTGGSTGPHLHRDQYSIQKPVDYDSNPGKYLQKSYDDGKTYIYFIDPPDM